MLSKTLLLITNDGKDIGGIILFVNSRGNSMTKASPGKKIILNDSVLFKLNNKSLARTVPESKYFLYKIGELLIRISLLFHIMLRQLLVDA